MGSWLTTLGNALLGLAEWQGRPAFFLRRTVVQQVYFTSLQAFGLANFIGFALGALVAIPLLNLGLNDTAVLALVMKVAVFHQLVPLMVALVVIGRSGTALTAEMGEFQAAGVLDALRMLGLDPDRFLVLPRVLGIAFSLLVLCFWANLSAVVGAGLFHGLAVGGSLPAFIRACTEVIHWADAGLTGLMVVCQATAIVLVHHGLGIQCHNAVTLQRNLPRAFVRSLLACVGLTLLFTAVRG